MFSLSLSHIHTHTHLYCSVDKILSVRYASVALPFMALLATVAILVDALFPEKLNPLVRYDICSHDATNLHIHDGN